MTRLSEIKARAKAATPGPWTWKMLGASCANVISNGKAITIGKVADCNGNVEFIAYSRSDIDWFVERVELLSGLLTSAQDVMTGPQINDEAHRAFMGQINAALEETP